MEQWNNKQNIDNDILSLRRIMQLRYLAMVMQSKNINIEDVEENTLQNAIDDVLKIDSCCIEKNISDEDNYIKYQIKVLFKILDTIIPNSKTRLSYTNSRYYFNIRNLDFIDELLDCYADKNDSNCKNLLNKKYDEISIDFRDFLYQGLIELAQNDKTNLQVKDVNREWNLRFNPISNEIYDIMESLEFNINFLICKSNQEDKDLEKLETVKNMLRKCADKVSAYIDKTEFPDLDKITISLLKQYALNKRVSQEKKK